MSVRLGDTGRRGCRWERGPWGTPCPLGTPFCPAGSPFARWGPPFARWGPPARRDPLPGGDPLPTETPLSGGNPLSGGDPSSGGDPHCPVGTPHCPVGTPFAPRRRAGLGSAAWAAFSCRTSRRAGWEVSGAVGSGWVGGCVGIKSSRVTYGLCLRPACS